MKCTKLLLVALMALNCNSVMADQNSFLPDYMDEKTFKNIY